MRYDLDFKLEVIAYYMQGHTGRATAEEFNLGYLLNGFCFKFVTVGSYFLGHGKLRLIRLVYQVYLYGFFSIAQRLYDSPIEDVAYLVRTIFL